MRLAASLSAIPEDRRNNMKDDLSPQNPFDLLRASDYSNAEVLEHWVDISADQGGLLEILKPRLVMPMLLLGRKGSGKPHLMRYCSAPVQAARYGGDLAKAVTAEQYLGIYVRAEGMNLQKFSGKGQDEDTWLAIFGMYFEFWLASNLLSSSVPLLNSERDREFTA